MECPKCGYLGFDQSPRCRNCSYDFSLMTPADDVSLEDIDLGIDFGVDRRVEAPVPAAASFGSIEELDAFAPKASGDAGSRPVFDPSELDALLQKAEMVDAAPADSQSVSIEMAAAEAPAGSDLDALAFDVIDAGEPVPSKPETISWPDPPPSLAQAAETAPAFELPALEPAAVEPPAPPAWAPPVHQEPPPPPASRPAFDVTSLDALDLTDVPDAGMPDPLPATDAVSPAALDRVMREARTLPAVSVPAFDDDAPLVRLQQPRAPVAVRKTPMSPKLRAVSRPTPQEPVFDFLESSESPAAGEPATSGHAGQATALESSPPLRRIGAAAIDVVLFAGIDLAVLYLTFRIVGLTAAEWRVLPVWPLVAFLAGMKLAYAAVFTALGGQTIGKMAAGIRVVSLDGRRVAPGVALRRAAASLVAIITVGLGYLPGLVGGDRRAVHDRLSGTRVVSLPAA